MPDFVTPAELRTYLDVDEGALPNARANDLLDDAEGMILDACHRTALHETGAEFRLDGRGNATLVVPVHPLTAVGSVIEDPDGEATELVEQVDYEWTARGTLSRLNGIWVARARWYEVTVDHGWPDAPRGFVAVVKRVAARGVDNPTALKSETAEGYAAGFGDPMAVTAADRVDLIPYTVAVGA